MSEKRKQKKISFPIKLWEDVENFASHNFIDESQEAQRFLIARGLKAKDHTPYKPLDKAVSKRNCYLLDYQWELINDFRFQHRLPSVTIAVIDLVYMGLLSEGYSRKEAD